MENRARTSRIVAQLPRLEKRAAIAEIQLTLKPAATDKVPSVLPHSLQVVINPPRDMMDPQPAAQLQR
jgi:hypothetical protein